ncbi:hypothetical protein OU415_06380 [Saccharopolyspora sp. WRP15-2]|uniref:Secreted protein n=1 Tax=Saccharopolyspora oryzae TaxID=2997343 RepID=A0ABT4UVG0_9PSEU|nr:hypothetical protein [Saccharopolyspora oryzae]MDA3625052.1 hypothetical protein [Saccharopolyspora oryzae]
MFWIQLSTFILFNLLILALLITHIPVPGLRLAAGQHAGTGDGEYTVWHLIADIEAENRAITPQPPAEPPQPQFSDFDPDDQPTGRHHLRL